MGMQGSWQVGRDGRGRAGLRQPQSLLGCTPGCRDGAAAAPHILASLLALT